MDPEVPVVPGDTGYPELLLKLADPPAKLYRYGELFRQDLLSVAIVGTRRPNPYGLHMARTISGGLAACGITVVSGLARGIDHEAHRSALDKGGRTIAVLGCGLNIEYPRGTAGLRERIAGNGAILSEFDPDTPPRPWNFPSRNRIISGLSLGVVVIQSMERSGSLITARWAMDQGREVMAVPGRADDPLSAGPISLIRDGAFPVCSALDVLSVLGLELLHRNSGKTLPGSDRKRLLVEALQPGPRLPDEIALSAGLPLSEALAGLTELEMEGAVVRGAGGIFRLN